MDSARLFAEDDSWLVQSKLTPPFPAGDLIVRPRLLADIQDSLLSARLSLVSAPAGYGKTTLLSSLVYPIGDGRPASIPVVWLTLDENDNELASFLAYLLAALRRLSGEFGKQTMSLLPVINSSETPIRRITAAVVNDILASVTGEAVLVLDDLHLIRQPLIYAVLDDLLDNLPPNLHFAVGTRHEPPFNLARLRARGQLREWRSPALRFRLDESEDFLNGRMNLQLSNSNLEALHAQLEGWPAGLRMFAQALSQVPTLEQKPWMDNLACAQGQIFDFLACEVLDAQSSDMRAFLLETSLLTELTPNLCQAVTRREDAGERLNYLAQHNLFISTLPVLPPSQGKSSIPTYRYHALFSQFLRQRLEIEHAERIPDLHQRAGQALGATPQAIEHYLLAQAWHQAAETIELLGQEIFARGLVQAVRRWERSLPSEIYQERPLLTWLFGNCHLLAGDFQAARLTLERTLERYPPDGDVDEPAMTYIGLATSALLEADRERAEKLIHQALAHPVPRHLLVQALMVRAWLALARADLPRAQVDLAAAQDMTEQGGDRLTWLLLGFFIRSDFAVLPGGLERLERFCRLAAVYVDGPTTPLGLILAELEAFIHLWRGRLEECIEKSQQALAMKDAMPGLSFLGGDAAACALMAHAARQEYHLVGPYARMLLLQLEESGLGRADIGGALFLQGRAAWCQGDSQTARQVYVQMCTAAHPGELPAAPALRNMLQALLHITDRRYAAAETLLHEALVLQRHAPTTPLFGSPALTLARLYLERKLHDYALAALRPILAACHQQGAPGLILKEGELILPVLHLAAEGGELAEYAAGLIALMGVKQEPSRPAAAYTGPALTPREIEVLRLLAAGADNRAIASALVVTERTAKAHVSNILHKLQVRSRLQAVAHAQQLGLL